MTKEDALFFLGRFRTEGINEKLYDALGVAIEALNTQTKMHENRTETHACDLISRQAAIDAVLKRDANCGIDAAETLKALPSAQQERKKGKWIYNSPVTMKCNQCGLVIKDWDWHRLKYCPNCIADMRGENDG